MKKALALLVVLSMVLSLALVGCGGGTTDPEGSTTATTDNSAAVSTDTTPVASGDPVTLTLWTHKPAFEGGFKAVGEAYTKKTGGKVKVDVKVFAGDDPYKQKLAAAGSTKSLPDIYVTWANVGESFVGEFNNDTVLEMTNLVDPTWKSTFLGSCWKDVTVKENDVKQWAKDTTATTAIKNLKVGQFYGVPLDVGAFFTIFGNKTLVKKAGLEAVAPKTWEDFIEMMKTVKAKTGTPGLVYGGKISDLWWNWAGGALETMANGEEGYRALLTRKEHMSEPKHLRVLQSLDAAYKADVLAKGLLDTNIDQADAAFANEEAAFNLGGSFTMASLVAMGMDPNDIFAFSVPALKGSKYPEWKVTPFTLLQMRVPTYTKHQKETLDFIKFITSSEGAVLYENTAYDVSAVDLTAFKDQRDPVLTAITKDFSADGGYLAKIEEYPVNYRANNEWRIVDINTQKLVIGKATPEQIAKDFDAQMDAELAREAATAATTK